MELALRGVFAGNIFDLGAAESTALFNAEGGVRHRAACYMAEETLLMQSVTPSCALPLQPGLGELTAGCLHP